MNKNYEKPVLDLIVFSQNDSIATDASMGYEPMPEGTAPIS